MKTLVHLMIIVGSLSFAGCASTTLFTTAPEGASVFIDGKEKGTTPYTYSDTKIALSSTPVMFKKYGYYDLDTVLKRNERPDVGALIGGLMITVPWLWFAKYKPNHFYELERVDSIEQAKLIITTLNDSLISNFETDSLGNTKKDNHIRILKDSSMDNSQRTSKSQFGNGIGLCLWGCHLGLNYTFIKSNNFGGSLRLNTNFLKSQNVPGDYYDDGIRVFTPKDYVNVLSFNLLREFSTSKKSVRFGIEAGPSWVNNRLAEFEPNPSYDPNPDPEVNWIYNLSNYKYWKSHSGRNTIGASILAKMEFLFSPSIGLEFAIFTNINNIKTITGFTCYFIFGDVRD